MLTNDQEEAMEEELDALTTTHGEKAEFYYMISTLAATTFAQGPHGVEEVVKEILFTAANFLQLDVNTVELCHKMALRHYMTIRKTAEAEKKNGRL